jgi:ferredoxin
VGVTVRYCAFQIVGWGIAHHECAGGGQCHTLRWRMLRVPRGSRGRFGSQIVGWGIAHHECAGGGQCHTLRGRMLRVPRGSRGRFGSQIVGWGIAHHECAGGGQCHTLRGLMLRVPMGSMGGFAGIPRGISGRTCLKDVAPLLSREDGPRGSSMTVRGLCAACPQRFGCCAGFCRRWLRKWANAAEIARQHGLEFQTQIPQIIAEEEMQSRSPRGRVCFAGACTAAGGFVVFA